MVDDIERRTKRRARVRFLLEVVVGFAISIAILTGLLYLATRDAIDDPSWPDPLFVWVGITGTILGLAALSWLDRSDPDAHEQSWRSRFARRSWLEGGLLAFLVWSTLYTKQTTGFGGPVYPWDMIMGGIRRAVRAMWAMLTGHSTAEDLFPF